MPIEKIARVNSVTPTDTVSSAASRSKTIQSQIMAKEQNLSRLSNDSKLSMEEKEKKRKELQKEIEELNRKLELMRQKQKEDEKKAEQNKKRKEALQSDSLKEKYKTDITQSTNNNSPDSVSDKQSQTDANKIHQEKVQQEKANLEDAQEMLNTNRNLREYMIETSANYDKENRVRVLRSEIKLNSLRGSETKNKQEQLDAMTQKENYWIKAKYEKLTEERSQRTQNEMQVHILE